MSPQVAAIKIAEIEQEYNRKIHQAETWKVEALLRLNGNPMPTIKDRIFTFCDYWNISYEDLTSNSRERELVKHRQCLMYILTKVLGYAYVSTGKELNRDHSTVTHANKIVKNCWKSPKLKNMYISELEMLEKSIAVMKSEDQKDETL